MPDDVVATVVVVDVDVVVVGVDAGVVGVDVVADLVIAAATTAGIHVIPAASAATPVVTVVAVAPW